LTLEKFKQLEEFHKLQKYVQQQKLIRQMRDAEANASALESYLANMHPNYRAVMPDVQAKMKRFVEDTFHSRGVTGQAVVDAFPASYQHLRVVIKS
jgi:hypothetical protein